MDRLRFRYLNRTRVGKTWDIGGSHDRGPIPYIISFIQRFAVFRIVCRVPMYEMQRQVQSRRQLYQL